MPCVPFVPSDFRNTYKAFGNQECFTDSVLQGYWNTAAQYLTPELNAACGVWTPGQQALGCNLMTAHICAIFTALQSGQPLQMVTDARIDKIAITVKPPPVQEGSQFQYWLGTSPYGVALLALLETATVGGWYVGGLPERDAFRRVGGGFGGVPPGWPC